MNRTPSPRPSTLDRRGHGPPGSRLLAIVLAAVQRHAAHAAKNGGKPADHGRTTPPEHAGAHFSFEELDVLDDGH